jgi:hypothetical protein
VADVDLYSEMAADAEAEAAAIPDDERLKSVAEMVERVRAIDRELMNFAEKVKILGDERKILVTEKIPDSLHVAGLSLIQMTDGSEVEVGTKVYASISEENRVAAHEWLRANGFAELIKNQFTVPFGKGEEERADALEAALLEAEIAFQRKEVVNPQTLGAFVREQIGREKQGRGPFAAPREVFGIYEEGTTKIVPPKRSK